MIAPIRFCDWDRRPALLVGDKAFAVLGRGEPWVPVDVDDVRETAGVMSERAWRRMFQGKFGRLDLMRWRPYQDNVPQDRPLPTKKDFDDAARTIAREHAATQAATQSPVMPDIEAPPIAP